MKKVIINQKRKKDFIWASGNILCKHLPNDFDTWTERKLNKIKKILKTNIKQWDETQHDPVEEFKLLVEIIEEK